MSLSSWTNGETITAARLNEIENAIQPEIFIINDVYNTLDATYNTIFSKYASGIPCIIKNGGIYSMILDIGVVNSTYWVNGYQTSSEYGFPVYDVPINV